MEEVEKLKEMLVKREVEKKEDKEKWEKMVENFRLVIDRLNRQVEEVSAENISLKEQCCDLTDTNNTLSTEKQLNFSHIFDLESKLKNSLKKAEKSVFLENRVNSLTEELHLWQEQYNFSKRRIEAADHELGLLFQHKKTLASVKTELGVALNETGVLSDKLEAERNHVCQLEKELENSRERDETFKRLLNTQEHISNEKLAAVNDKYLQIKEINAALQKRISELVNDLQIAGKRIHDLEQQAKTEVEK